ncbi:g11607 [Coccomyxa elongata]
MMDFSELPATTVTAAELQPLPRFDPLILCGALTAVPLRPTGWALFLFNVWIVLRRIEGGPLQRRRQQLRRCRIGRAGGAAGVTNLTDPAKGRAQVVDQGGTPLRPIQ